LSLVLFLASLVVVVLAAYYPRSWITLTELVMFSSAGVVLLCVIYDCLRCGCFSPIVGMLLVSSDARESIPEAKEATAAEV
jgi:hypothetical protein